MTLLCDVISVEKCVWNVKKSVEISVLVYVFNYVVNSGFEHDIFL